MTKEQHSRLRSSISRNRFISYISLARFWLGGLFYRTDNEYQAYLQSNYFPTAPESDINQLLQLYPQDPAQGSPFGTGDLNEFTPEYKRLAAIQGDMIFQVPRRFFVQQMSSKQNVWSFCKWSFLLLILQYLKRCCMNSEQEDEGAPHSGCCEFFNIWIQLVPWLMSPYSTMDPTSPTSSAQEIWLTTSSISSTISTLQTQPASRGHNIPPPRPRCWRSKMAIRRSLSLQMIIGKRRWHSWNRWSCNSLELLWFFSPSLWI